MFRYPRLPKIARPFRPAALLAAAALLGPALWLSPPPPRCRGSLH